MKVGLLGVLLFVGVLFLRGGELPSSCFGTYGGEMPAYTVEVNGNEVFMEKHDLYIRITPTEISYKSSHVDLVGTYTVLRSDKNTYLIKAQVSNGKTIQVEFDLVWNKKTLTLLVTPKNGTVEALLEKTDI
jgi:hypothetical protein